jgi:hypothetical protein
VVGIAGRATDDQDGTPEPGHHHRRDKIIVCAQRWDGICPIAEFALLGGQAQRCAARHRDTPRRTGPRQAHRARVILILELQGCLVLRCNSISHADVPSRGALGSRCHMAASTRRQRFGMRSSPSQDGRLGRSGRMRSTL